MNNGGAAFPTKIIGGYDDGMSLRDWYAGMALQGILAANTLYPPDQNEKLFAGTAYILADAMLKARK